MNAAMSVIVTEARIYCPTGVPSSLYCITMTEITEIEGTEIARARIKSDTNPYRKRLTAIMEEAASGTRKLVMVRKVAFPMSFLRISVLSSRPIRKIMKKREIVEMAPICGLKVTTPRTVGPSIRPLRSSPATDGSPNCLNISPTIAAVARTTRICQIMSVNNNRGRYLNGWS